MSAAAINLARMPRRRKVRPMGDLYDTPWVFTGTGAPSTEGGGITTDATPVLPPSTMDPNPTVLPPDAGFSSADTVSVQQLQQENQSYSNLQTPQPYFGPVSSQFAPFLTFATGVGGGGGSDQAGVLRPIAPRTGVVANPVMSAPASALSSVESWFSQPIYAGSAITWGWALLGGVALWLLFRK